MAMRPFKRSEPPSILAEHGEEWGRDFEESGNFHWHIDSGQKVNHILLPALKLQTQEHCSFCDGFPVSTISNETIEHFHPKSKYPLKAFLWENLYFCCDRCQTNKGEKFDDLLLRPDAVDYCFDDYFRWDLVSGELHANPNSSQENQDRANITIKL